MSLEDLKNKATELNIEFDEEITEDDLSALVTEKEEELSSDLDYLKEQVSKWETEAKKAFEKRDMANKEKRKLSKKLKDLEDQMKETVSKEKLEELQEQFEDLKKFKEDADKLKEEEELKKLDDVERTKISFEKKLDKMKEDMDKMKKSFERDKGEALQREKDQFRTIEKLRGNKLESEVLRAASKYNAYNPDQIVALTKSFFTYDDQLEKYSHIVRNKEGNIVDELPVDEYIKTFLGKEENENLVKSGASSSSFDTKTQSRADTDKGKKKDTGTGKYKADDPQIVEEASEQNLDPEDWARIKEKRDKKLAKMREDKNK